MSTPQILVLVALVMSLAALAVATRTKQLGILVVAYAVLIGAQLLLLFALVQLAPGSVAWLVPVAALGLLAYNAVRWLWRVRNGLPTEAEPDAAEPDDVSWLSTESPPDSDTD